MSTTSSVKETIALVSRFSSGKMDGETMTPVAKLPPELWVKILARLPAYDLVRFRCISKTWCSIIDDPSFIYLHLHTFKDNSDKSLYLFWENYLDVFESELRIRARCRNDFRGGAEITSIKYSKLHVAFEPSDYVNGLMLFGMYTRDTCYEIYLDSYLFNPSLRKFLLLPTMPSHPGRNAVMILGFDHVGNDHKVVAVVFPVQDSQVTSPGFILVYELSTRCWRVNSNSRIGVHQEKGSMKKGVYAKGVTHWIYYDSSLVPRPRNYTHVVSFDFSSEEFSYLSLPGDRDDGCEILTFPFVLGDSFSILDITSTINCIWVLSSRCGDDGRDSSWSKWYTGASDLDTFGFFLKHKDDINHVLYVEKIGKFLLAVKAKGVMFYDIETHMMEGIISQGICMMEPFVESLLLSEDIGSSI